MSKPGRVWYWLGGALIFASAPVFVYFLVTTALEVTNPSHRMVAPGESVMTFDEPGPYTISHEFVSDFSEGGFRTVSTDISSLDVLVRQESSGRNLKVQAAAFDITYSLPGREGAGILSINLPDPGEYRIIAELPEEAGEVVLAVHPNSVGTVFLGLGLAFGVPLLLVFLGFVVIIRTFVRRRSSKDRKEFDPREVAEFRGTDYR